MQAATLDFINHRREEEMNITTDKTPTGTPINPLAGSATPGGIAAAAAAARGSMPDTALLLHAFQRLATVQDNAELRLLCINLELVLAEE